MVLPGQARPAAGLSGEEELLAFVREMVGKFCHWVECEGGWKVCTVPARRTAAG